MRRYFCLLALGLVMAGCHKTNQGTTGENMTIKNGSTVSINYTLTVDGKVADTSVGHEPLVYVQGSGQIIEGLEEQLEGLKKGDKKAVVVDPEKGYGISHPEAIQKIPKKAFDGAEKLKVGDAVSGKVNEKEFQAIVASVGPNEITIDLNHPLAGKTLNFEVEVVDVK